MTPPPHRMPYYPREATPPRPEPTIKVELMRQVLGMILAGLVSYFATVYGLQERIKVLEVRLDYLKSALDDANGELRVIRGQHEQFMVDRLVAPPRGPRR